MPVAHDRSKLLNKSVDMTLMLTRDDLAKADNLDPTDIKLKRTGYEAITGKFTTADYSTIKDGAKEKVCADL